MKRLGIALGLALLIAAMTSPAFAWGPGCAWGGGYGPGYQQGYGPGYSNLTPDQLSKLDQLNHKFYNETVPLRNELWAKSGQLQAMLNSSNPDPGKVQALQKEIGDLRTKLAQERDQYNLEARKIAPGAGYAWGYGRGYYGPPMGRDYGPSYAPGYGPGYCWNY
jgi:zinc resistance-associated protein